MYRALTCARCTRPIDARIAVCHFCGQRRLGRHEATERVDLPAPEQLPIPTPEGSRVGLGLLLAGFLVASAIALLVALR